MRVKNKRAKRANPEHRFLFPVVIEKDEDGYFASCPTLQGCYTQADTYEEILKNLDDVIRLHVEDRLANGEPIPTYDQVSLTTIEVRL